MATALLDPFGAPKRLSLSDKFDKFFNQDESDSINRDREKLHVKGLS